VGLVYCPRKGNVFEKVNFEIVQRQVEGRNLLNASQFGFRANHSKHCYDDQVMPFLSPDLTHAVGCKHPRLTAMMSLMDHVTLNFKNKMYTAAVFLDIEKSLTFIHS
jgi:hypothetical protein